jgi:uncharacterized membrane protein YeaQ/YmgE (transglycosylase-associated protein family)
MGVIAWIILGLVAGLIAERLVPSRNREGMVITTVIGILGALLGGFIAYHVFHVVGIQGFFNASTWITAIAGSAVLILAYHALNGQNRSRSRVGSSKRRRTGRR